jgi:subtilisin family serine protease
VLCAPGVDVVSALPAAEKFGEMSGTSMATPHVAGLAALLFEAKPAATIDEVQDAIVASCQNLAAEPQSRIGAGIPDGLKAIAAL